MATTTVTPTAGLAAVTINPARTWWVYLITGGAWILFGTVVLTAHDKVTTVWSIAVLAGVLFFLMGFSEFINAAVAESWRWLHIVFGIAGIVAGCFAFVWPGQTFLSLAAIIGWYLLAVGTIQVAASLAAREVDDLWWLVMLIGIGELVIGFWALGYPGRSIRLLI